MGGKNRVGIRFRLACLVGHQEFVADGIARGVEKAAATVNVAPALENETFVIVANEEIFGKGLVRNIGNVFRPGDMGFARPAKFEFGTVFPAIRAMDQKHRGSTFKENFPEACFRRVGHTAAFPSQRRGKPLQELLEIIEWFQRRGPTHIDDGNRHHVGVDREGLVLRTIFLLADEIDQLVRGLGAQSKGLFRHERPVAFTLHSLDFLATKIPISGMRLPAGTTAAATPMFAESITAASISAPRRRQRPRR